LLLEFGLPHIHQQQRLRQTSMKDDDVAFAVASVLRALLVMFKPGQQMQINLVDCAAG